MAKIVKMKPDNDNKKEVAKNILDEKLSKGDLSLESKKLLDDLNIHSAVELFDALALMGIDPKKIIDSAMDGKDPDDFNYDDFKFDDDDPDGEPFRNFMESLGGFDEDFMHPGIMPEGLFLDTDTVKEYHIRIKLNNSPVKIWRELKVPSNISLELLAQVLIISMGWFNTHLHQFVKPDVNGSLYYKSARDLKEEEEDKWFFPFSNRSHNAGKTPLQHILSTKGKRIRLEYDFGDSWEHDIWIKGIRDYEDGETPKVSLVKGMGQCPPEDCGGVWGYEDLLYFCMKKRRTKEEQERLEWYGIDHRYYDPDFFDMEETSAELEVFMEAVREEIEKRKKNTGSNP